MLGQFFKKARLYLGFSANEVAKTLKISGNSIADVEKNRTQNINWFYFQFLVSKGINPFYLLGKSNEIKSVPVEYVPKGDFDKLESKCEDLEARLSEAETELANSMPLSAYKELWNKYEALKTKNANEEESNKQSESAIKKGKASKKRPTRSRNFRSGLGAQSVATA